MSAADSRTVHLLVNPASRRGASVAERVRSQLVAAGHRVERLAADSAAAVAPAIDRAAPQRVVAVGGDGLVHHALPALVNGNVPLGIVPSGTGNDFARALGIPKRRRAAVDRAVGPVNPVDVLRVQHADGSTTLAATAVTAGFSGRVTASANSLRFPRGQLRYTIASVTELRRLESFDLRVLPMDHPTSSDEVAGTSTDSSGPCTFFAAANTRYFGGGMAIAPKAEAADGLVHLTVVKEVPAWKLALVLPTVFVGQHVRHPSVTEVTGTALGLEHDQPVWADGELIGMGPITVSVVPKALFVGAF